MDQKRGEMDWVPRFQGFDLTDPVTAVTGFPYWVFSVSFSALVHC